MAEQARKGRPVLLLRYQREALAPFINALAVSVDEGCVLIIEGGRHSQHTLFRRGFESIRTIPVLDHRMSTKCGSALSRRYGDRISRFCTPQTDPNTRSRRISSQYGKPVGETGMGRGSTQ
jgi:hypothetical protein